MIDITKITIATVRKMEKDFKKMDFSKDNAAFALAKYRLGPKASWSEVARLAAKIKTEEL